MNMRQEKILAILRPNGKKRRPQSKVIKVNISNGFATVQVNGRVMHTDMPEKNAVERAAEIQASMQKKGIDYAVDITHYDDVVNPN